MTYERAVIREHETIVKFTGHGHRAHCITPGCRFIGEHRDMIRMMATGYPQAVAWQRTKTQAEDDARGHRNTERGKALLQKQREQREGLPQAQPE